MRKMFLLICASLLPLAALAQTEALDVSPNASDLQDQIQDLKQELNQLEISSEMAAGKSAKTQNATFGLAGGSFEQDFESNSDAWTILQGQTVRLKFFANPMEGVTGHLDLEVWGNVAPDIFHFDSRVQLVQENEFMAIREFDTSLSLPDLSVTAFKGLGYGGYYFTRDDFYYLLPDQNDVDKYFRISGTSLPIGMRATGSNALEGLEIFAGYELQWGNPAEIYGLYQHALGSTTVGLIDRLTLPQINANPQGPDSAVPVTGTTAYTPTLNTVELTWKIPIGDWQIDAVGIYRPESPTANKNYTYVTQVGVGQGTDGSGYEVHQATISDSDALGAQIKISSQHPPLFDSFMINGEYSGLTAGDLERVSAELTEVPFSQSVITFDVTYQQPLIGPNPLVYTGNSSNYLGPALVQPRGEYDPFQVTSNPISGVNNREMTKLSLSFVYNPGNGWFFKYIPNNFGAYNINTDIDTPFSLGLSGSMINYPTGTDLLSAVEVVPGETEATLQWEGLGDLGQAPTNGFQPYGQGWMMLRTGSVHWIANVEGGFSESALSWNDSQAPSTDAFISSLSARMGDTTLTAGYALDNWGPEDWDRQFGVVIGQDLLFQITEKWGVSVITLKYEKWSNNPGDDPIYQHSTVSINDAIPLPTQELYSTIAINF